MGQKHFVFAMSTHRGRVRAGNEDACDASPEHGLFVVCDGMGGAAAGEIASHLACQTFLAVATGKEPPAPPERGHSAIQPPLSPANITPANATAGDRLAEAIRTANTTVYRKAHEAEEFEGMGTTLVSLQFEPVTPPSPAPDPTPSGLLWIAHVGDSRCYLHRAGQIHLMTQDHSVVEEQFRAGVITRAEAEVSPLRHVITRAVGSHHRVEAEIHTLDVYPGDLLLLASDGLNRELTDEDIHYFLTQIPITPDEADLDRGCQSLIEAANHNGGHDNITVLLLAIC